MTKRARIIRARELRRIANPAEEHAWSVLRKLRAYGYPVRRQYPVGGYTVDFAITRAKLILEIDGGIHHLEDVQGRDAARDEKLMRLGWRILRLDAEQSRDGDFLMRTVIEAIESQTGRALL